MARITGEVLALTILQWLQACGLTVTDMRGWCYDGASNMSGARSSCKSIVQQEAPLAMYHHCVAHCFNLTGFLFQLQSLTFLVAVHILLHVLQVRVYNESSDTSYRCSLCIRDGELYSFRL